jgi:alpha-beta hydrolase superfamily lysophospholipase
MKASEFASIGYHAVIFDLRAQGKSEGEFCTYGFNEKHDVKIITDRLIHLYPELPIGVFGVSLGGAIAYQCLANDNRLSFGIIESTFDDLKNVVREYTARFAGFRCDWVADFALWRAEQLAAFKSEEVVPWKCAAAIHVPVFVSHGNEDKNIPISFGKHNFENLGNPACKFYEVSGADHNNLNHVGGKTYQAAMNSFLEEQVRE